MGDCLFYFVNTVRKAQGFEPLRGLSVRNADPDDESRCVLALAMGCTVGLSEQAGWAASGRWVMRFAGRGTAAKVAAATGLSWLPNQNEVALPWEVADFAVSAHLGFVETDSIGNVVSWFVPPGDVRVLLKQLPERESMHV